MNVTSLSGGKFLLLETAIDTYLINEGPYSETLYREAIPYRFRTVKEIEAHMAAARDAAGDDYSIVHTKTRSVLMNVDSGIKAIYWRIFNMSNNAPAYVQPIEGGSIDANTTTTTRKRRKDRADDTSADSGA